MRKKTHEEYVVELAIKNPTVEVVGEYDGANTKIKHHCLLHNVYWDINPHNILKGQGCSECKKDKIGNFRRKTHEQYVEEIKNINPHIEVLEQYINANTPILHRCMIHNIKWVSTPESVINGCGCIECGKESYASKRCKTHEQYIKELALVNKDIAVLDKYIDSKTPILHKCLIHDVEWDISPNNALSGRGCPKCKSEKISSKNTKTHEQYINEVKEINSNVIVLGHYINAKTPILHKCTIHNVEWITTPDVILMGCGCPECWKERLSISNGKSHEHYIKELSIINPNIIALEKYSNAHTPILHKCLIHNVEWKTSLTCVLYMQCGCPKCKSEKISEKATKTHEQYCSEVSKINKDIMVVEKYINSHTPILHKCLIDGYEWKTTPTNILGKHGCPKCNASKGEKRIQELLTSYGILFETQKRFENCRDKAILSFDFYLPDYNACIEYQGIQHYYPVDYFGGEKSFEIQQLHDKIKDGYCKENDIFLLCIPYYADIEEELNNFLFI